MAVLALGELCPDLASRSLLTLASSLATLCCCFLCEESCEWVRSKAPRILCVVWARGDVTIFTLWLYTFPPPLPPAYDLQSPP